MVADPAPPPSDLAPPQLDLASPLSDLGCGGAGAASVTEAQEALAGGGRHDGRGRQDGGGGTGGRGELEGAAAMASRRGGTIAVAGKRGGAGGRQQAWWLWLAGEASGRHDGGDAVGGARRRGRWPCNARRSPGGRHGERRRGQWPWREEAWPRRVSVRHDEADWRGGGGRGLRIRRGGQRRHVETGPQGRRCTGAHAPTKV
uniref:Uncharacterized protein n=1 Tax=Oryza sativa subsp. japonica TaxID=39947 RepID=Q5VP45_ORYSJ|nr:uncharacterized protein LOC107281234 [Oryza sativa Japonica Group]BAD68780.1 hypothetical protein [Oryza sativa Japonica Group]